MIGRCGDLHFGYFVLCDIVVWYGSVLKLCIHDLQPLVTYLLTHNQLVASREFSKIKNAIVQQHKLVVTQFLFGSENWEFKRKNLKIRISFRHLTLQVQFVEM